MSIRTAAAARGHRTASALGLVIVVAGLLGYTALAIAIGRTHDLASLGVNPPGDRAAFIVYCLAGVSSVLVGGLVANRRPDHPVGWLLLGIGLGWLLINCCFLYSAAAYTRSAAPGLLANLALTATAPLQAATLTMVAVVVAVFPTGRVSGRWRHWLLAVVALVLVANIIGYLLRPELQDGAGHWHRNLSGLPVGGDVINGVLAATWVVLALFALVVALDVVFRLRRSAGGGAPADEVVRLLSCRDPSSPCAGDGR